MKIINQSKNTLLAERAVVADTFFKRIKGLLGKKELSAGNALILKPGNSIHTFFMRFKIDVLFVDRQNKIIQAVPGLTPFRITRLYWQAALVIELPAGTLASTFTAAGDKISFLTSPS